MGQRRRSLNRSINQNQKTTVQFQMNLELINKKNNSLLTLGLVKTHLRKQLFIAWTCLWFGCILLGYTYTYAMIFSSWLIGCAIMIILTIHYRVMDLVMIGSFVIGCLLVGYSMLGHSPTDLLMVCCFTLGCFIAICCAIGYLIIGFCVMDYIALGLSYVFMFSLIIAQSMLPLRVGKRSCKHITCY